MLFENVDYIPLDTLFAALQINRATGYRYLKRITEVLNNTNVWAYESGDGSLNKQDIQIFETYTHLALEHNPKFAAKNLIQELSRHGYNIQQNPETNPRTNARKSTGKRTNEHTTNDKSSDFYDSLFRV